jgi:hypothetical protein
MNFLYVKIPVAKPVSEYDHELEDKVDQMLRKDGVGSVAGWGESLGRALPDGSRPVAHTRIDVDISNLASARELLQANLPSFGALAGTEIHYTVDHHRLKDVYGAAGWVCGQEG